MNISEAIRQIIAKRDLTFEQAHEVMGQIMGGQCTDAQIGAYLVGLQMKGESPPEIAGSARAMREALIPIPTRHSPEVVTDTCGTGGDGKDTFNISTIAAFVAAGAGVIIAKHGNRAVSSKCGSADVLKELGINIEATPDVVGRCLDEVGIGFLFAPTLHPAMKYAIGPRREIGVRSIFNILGPLTNPAGAKRQVLGVFSAHLLPLMAETLQQLGAIHVMVVHSSDGLDELSSTARVEVAEVKHGNISRWEMLGTTYGIPPAQEEDLKGGDPAHGARIAMEILQGEKGPKRDIVVLNAAAAIYVGGKADTLKDAIAVAQQSIDEGHAMRKLERMKTVMSDK